MFTNQINDDRVFRDVRKLCQGCNKKYTANAGGLCGKCLTLSAEVEAAMAEKSLDSVRRVLPEGPG